MGAKLYRAPIKPPAFSECQVDGQFDIDLCRKIEGEYLEALRGLAKRNGSSDLLGEIVRWHRGDGFAQYMVWNTSPLELVWIELGDAWSVEDALLRGLRLSDITGMVEQSRRLAKFLAESRAEREAQAAG